MKVAVCLYGFLRDWEIHRASLNQNVIGKYNADLFGCFPYQRREDSNDIIGSDELESHYQNLNSLYRWDYNVNRFVRETESLPKLNKHKQMPHRIFSMFFHISKVVQLCIESGVEYDWIFVTRPDVTIKRFDIEMAEPDKLNTKAGLGHYVPKYDVGFDDKFLLGGENILKLSSLYESVYEYAANRIFDEPIPAPEEIICHHLLKDGWGITKVDFIDVEFEHTCSKLCGHHILRGDRDENFDINELI